MGAGAAPPFRQAAPLGSGSWTPAMIGGFHGAQTSCLRVLVKPDYDVVIFSLAVKLAGRLVAALRLIRQHALLLHQWI